MGKYLSIHFNVDVGDHEDSHMTDAGLVIFWVQVWNGPTATNNRREKATKLGLRCGAKKKCPMPTDMRVGPRAEVRSESLSMHNTIDTSEYLQWPLIKKRKQVTAECKSVLTTDLATAPLGADGALQCPTQSDNGVGLDG